MKDTKPSRTAEYMALFRAVESAEPPERRLFNDPYAIPLLSGTLRRLARISGTHAGRWLVRRFLDLGWPYTRSSGVVRTRVIDDLVLQAIAAGAEQMVLLGAGFDSRAYRLPEARRIDIFEVDHPATQQAKRERLRALREKPRANVHFVDVDFETAKLEDELARHGFDKDRRTIAVWEGVVSYLTKSAVDRNLAVLARLLATGSRLIFTYMDRHAIDGSGAFRGARRWNFWVRFSGEPFIFGFDPVRLRSELEPHGFILDQDLSTAEAARRYRALNGREESGSEAYRIATAIRAGV